MQTRRNSAGNAGTARAKLEEKLSSQLLDLYLAKVQEMRELQGKNVVPRRQKILKSEIEELVCFEGLKILQAIPVLTLLARIKHMKTQGNL